mmetsp:Transcript_324/g.506  ORF Transcript_324/g.506 Transcript_324/m.506 type:complete len:119 (-) Transcript_324:231-587(-)
MGNCCGLCGDDDTPPSSRGQSQRVFSGQGHRLGSANDGGSYGAPPPNMQIGGRKDDVPDPIVDPNLDDDIRDLRRAEAARAAEERAKKLGGTKPKKKPKNQEPLRGPNSEPLMRWTAS